MRFLFKKVFNNTMLHKILVIFIVGLVSRAIVNYICDINVFKDYANVISLTYYGGFAYFVAAINNLFMHKASLVSEGIIKPVENFDSSVLYINKGSETNHGKKSVSSGKSPSIDRDDYIITASDEKIGGYAEGNHYVDANGKPVRSLNTNRPIDQSRAQHNTYD